MINPVGSSAFSIPKSSCSTKRDELIQGIRCVPVEVIARRTIILNSERDYSLDVNTSRDVCVVVPRLSKISCEIPLLNDWQSTQQAVRRTNFVNNEISLQEEVLFDEDLLLSQETRELEVLRSKKNRNDCSTRRFVEDAEKLKEDVLEEASGSEDLALFFYLEEDMKISENLQKTLFSRVKKKKLA